VLGLFMRLRCCAGSLRQLHRQQDVAEELKCDFTGPVGMKERSSTVQPVVTELKENYAAKVGYGNGSAFFNKACGGTLLNKRRYKAHTFLPPSSQLMGRVGGIMLMSKVRMVVFYVYWPVSSREAKHLLMYDKVCGLIHEWMIQQLTKMGTTVLAAQGGTKTGGRPPRSAMACKFKKRIGGQRTE